ncbi:MAG: hypothetical protein KBG73_17300 [Candidatus Promineofilum sp.]|nr:hypothetical protein [Promineifilum sp.]
MWENGDVIPRPGDVFQERLYCVRWVETYVDDKGNERTRRHYRAPTTEDHAREARVLALLRDRFDEWQARGYLPSRRIEPGAKTDEPIRTRGWTHWHHLFTPRQLLMHGLLQEQGAKLKLGQAEQVGIVLGVGRCADWNSRLSRWDSSAANEKVAQTFSNQALNTMSSFAGRGFTSLGGSWFLKLLPSYVGSSVVEPVDARHLKQSNDIWMTDPPYADAVNYEELSEFFLVWYEKALEGAFPKWYSDSKRAIAVKGNDDSFRYSMVECYRQLTVHMPDDGMQVVMFTHQDAAVWADLSLILWAAGLRVTAAWTIATETESALKTGNYVQGTVLLVLRKRDEAAAAVFLDEVLPRVESEVRRQLDSMTTLDDASNPNFGDADYQLAAYAAALRVLTAQPIDEIDPAREIARARRPGEVGPVESLIRQAVAIAADHLVPGGIQTAHWKRLAPLERFYLKGLEVESHGEYRHGVYQELARGYGAADYTELLAGAAANETRLKSATEFGRRGLSGGGFAATTLRHVLYAVALAGQDAGAPAGLDYLRTELADYWAQRERLIALLEYLAGFGRVGTMPAWRDDGRAAGVLAGRCGTTMCENDRRRPAAAPLTTDEP